MEPKIIVLNENVVTFETTIPEQVIPAKIQSEEFHVPEAKVRVENLTKQRVIIQTEIDSLNAKIALATPTIEAYKADKATIVTPVEPIKP